MPRKATLCVWGFVCLLVIRGSLNVAYAQQYMKTVDGVDDNTFNGWVNNKQMVKCHAIAHAAYSDGPDEIMALGGGERPSGMCYWDIDRAAELAPPALVVHSGTRVFIRVKNPRQNEMVLPSLVFAKVIPPSPGNDILKNAINPLQAITLAPVIRNGGNANYLIADVAPPPDPCTPPTPPVPNPAFNPADCQHRMVEQVNSIQASINHANAALACLESYEVATATQPSEDTDPPPDIPAYSCSTKTMIDPAKVDPDDCVTDPELSEINHSAQCQSFASQKALVLSRVQDAIDELPPLATWTKLDNFITNVANQPNYPNEITSDVVIKGAIGAIQTAQANLQQSLVLLMAIPNTVTSKFYYFDVPRLATATATITATEIVSKTSSTIATWTTSSTSYNFVFSAGLGFSNLVNRTFTNTPQVVNGVPVLNSSGNALSIVTETDNHLSVMAPEIMGSYVLPHLRTLDSACSFGCSLLVSGGIGANLTTKSADFDGGLSVRLSDVLITPSVHWGRETRLIDGITVGSQLGANAPSALPTTNKWVKKFGIAFTYVIPLT